MHCRACMQLDESGDVVDMGSVVPGDTKSFYDYFNECTQLEAHSMDKLPQLICSTCSQILQVAYAFIRDARQSDEKLKELLEMQEAEEDLMYCKTEETAEEHLEMQEGEEDLMYCKTEETNEELLEMQEAEENSMYYKIEDTEETALGEYDLMIELQPMTQSEPVIRENSKSPENLSVDLSQNKHSLSSLKVEVECDEDELVEFYVCSVCTSKFRLNKTYIQHMKKVHNQIICPSPDCDENEKNLHECEICNLILKSRSNAWAHKKRKHPEDASADTNESESPPFCTICSQFFKSKPSYRHHVRTFHVENANKEENEKKWQCEICKMTFKYRSSIYEHKRRNHPKVLTKTSTLDNFIKTSNNIATEVGEENERDNLIKDSNSIVTEVAEEDEQTSFVECKFCHKEISRKQISSHETRHRYHQKRQKTFLCASCPRVYKSQSSLSKHITVCHIKPPPEECPICGNKFRNLKLHIKNIHTAGEFKCPICGDTFKNNERLYCHKIRHLKRNLACKFCDKKFVRSAELRVHLRKHTGEEPYACHLCNRSFRIKSQLTYHVERHAGVKRNCKFCGKEFASIKNLRLHTFKHTGMPYKCPVCDYGCGKRDYFSKHLLKMHNITMTAEEFSEMYKANTGRHPQVRNQTIEKVIREEAE